MHLFERTHGGMTQKQALALRDEVVAARPEDKRDLHGCTIDRDADGCLVVCDGATMVFYTSRKSWLAYSPHINATSYVYVEE